MHKKEIDRTCKTIEERSFDYLKEKGYLRYSQEFEKDMPTIKRYFGKMFHGQLHIFQEEIEKGKRKPMYRPPPPKIPQEEEEEKASQWSKKSQSPKSDLPSTPTSTSTETAQDRVAKAHTALEKIMKGKYDDSLEGIPLYAYHDALESLGTTSLKRVGETVARWLNERRFKAYRSFVNLNN